MRRLRFILSILGLALAAIPASATIMYTSCTSGCGSSSGSYAGMPSANGATGLAFSSPITFVSAGLAGTPFIYTDSTTGTVFNGFSGTMGDSLNVTGTALVQSTSGSGTSIQFVPPANTYALAMMVGTNSFASPWIELVTSPSALSSGLEQYQLIVPNSSSPQFFGIVSDAPIVSLFVWNSGGTGGLNLQSFEIGQESGAPTSEAATFFTMGGGLLGLYVLRRPISFRLRMPIRARRLLGPQTRVA